jgi:alpha-beta hydrolase superfamily lysophospholipase
MWGAPVFAAAQSKARDAKKRAHNLQQYAAKLLRPATYLKLFSGRLDTKSIASAMRGGGAREDKNREAQSEEEARGQLTPRWRENAVREYSRRALPLLLIYGTADPVMEEALAWYRENSASSPSVHFVEGANHAFYGLEWEREVFDETTHWLRRLASDA